MKMQLLETEGYAWVSQGFPSFRDEFISWLAFGKMFPFHANTTEDRESEEGEEGTKQKLCWAKTLPERCREPAANIRATRSAQHLEDALTECF